MKSFRQYLTESAPIEQLIQSPEQWDKFCRDYDTLIGFFNVGYGNVHGQATNGTAALIRDLRGILGLGSPAGETLYRIFPQETMRDALPSSVLPEFDKIRYGRQQPILDLVRNALVGQEIPLKTGIVPIQNWTSDRDFPLRFHNTIRHDQFGYYVIAQSDFSSDEILFSYKDFSELVTIWKSVLQNVTRSGTAPSIVAKIQQYAQESVILSAKTGQESEYIVQTTIPRRVKVLQILGMR